MVARLTIRSVLRALVRAVLTTLLKPRISSRIVVRLIRFIIRRARRANLRNRMTRALCWAFAVKSIAWVAVLAVARVRLAVAAIKARFFVLAVRLSWVLRAANSSRIAVR